LGLLGRLSPGVDVGEDSARRARLALGEHGGMEHLSGSHHPKRGSKPAAASGRKDFMADHGRIGEGTCSLLPMDIEGVGAMAELALDIRWSWNHAADELWQELDRIDVDCLATLMAGGRQRRVEVTVWRLLNELS
jgi:hypothetical protein